MQDKVTIMVSNIQNKISELEILSIDFKENLQKSFLDLHNNLSSIKRQISGFETPSNKIIDNVSNKIAEAERMLAKLYAELEGYKSNYV